MSDQPIQKDASAAVPANLLNLDQSMLEFFYFFFVFCDKIKSVCCIILEAAIIHRILLNKVLRIITALVLFGVVLPSIFYIIFFSREYYDRNGFDSNPLVCSHSEKHHIKCGHIVSSNFFFLFKELHFECNVERLKQIEA